MASGSEDVAAFSQAVDVLLESRLAFQEQSLGGGEWQVTTAFTEPGCPAELLVCCGSSTSSKLTGKQGCCLSIWCAWPVRGRRHTSHVRNNFNARQCKPLAAPAESILATRPML